MAPLASRRVHLRLSSCAASSRSPSPSRCGSSPAWPSSSARTAPGSRTSPTRSSGRRARWRRPSCAPRSRTTCSSPAAEGRAAEDFCEVELLFDNPDGDGPFAVLRAVGRAAAAPRRRGPVPAQPHRRPPHRPRRAARGPRARRRDALDHRPGPRRGDPRLQARGAPRAARGGRGPRQVQAPQASRGAEARAGRDSGRACARRRGRGEEAAAAARAAGDGGGARGEATRRDRIAAGARRPARPRAICTSALEDGEGRRTAALLARRTRGRDSSSRCSRSDARAEEELADAAGRREQATATLYRLRSARERLELRRESGRGDARRIFATSSQRPRRVLDARVRAERERSREQARVARERLPALERSLAEREGLPPAARALAEQGERLALSLLDVEPGIERAVAAALGHRASALVADDARAAFALARACARGRPRQLVVLTLATGASSCASCRSCRRRSCSRRRFRP